jgi:hypothetical protein
MPVINVKIHEIAALPEANSVTFRMSNQTSNLSLFSVIPLRSKCQYHKWTKVATGHRRNKNNLS